MRINTEYMNKPEPDNWPLVHPKDDGIRPNGQPDQCFYCGQSVGQPHARDCVAVSKRARFKITLEVDIDRPCCWDKSDYVGFMEEHGFEDVWEALGQYFETGDPDDGPQTIHSADFQYMGISDHTPRIKIADDSEEEEVA
jgi:hypothetical protein